MKLVYHRLNWYKQELNSSDVSSVLEQNLLCSDESSPSYLYWKDCLPVGGFLSHSLLCASWWTPLVTSLFLYVYCFRVSWTRQFSLPPGHEDVLHFLLEALLFYLSHFLSAVQVDFFFSFFFAWKSPLVWSWSHLSLVLLGLESQAQNREQSGVCDSQCPHQTIRAGLEWPSPLLRATHGACSLFYVLCPFITWKCSLRGIWPRPHLPFIPYLTAVWIRLHHLLETASLPNGGRGDSASVLQPVAGLEHIFCLYISVLIVWCWQRLGLPSFCDLT